MITSRVESDICGRPTWWNWIGRNCRSRPKVYPFFFKTNKYVKLCFSSKWIMKSPTAMPMTAGSRTSRRSSKGSRSSRRRDHKFWKIFSNIYINCTSNFCLASKASSSGKWTKVGNRLAQMSTLREQGAELDTPPLEYFHEKIILYNIVYWNWIREGYPAERVRRRSGVAERRNRRYGRQRYFCCTGSFYK